MPPGDVEAVIRSDRPCRAFLVAAIARGTIGVTMRRHHFVSAILGCCLLAGSAVAGGPEVREGEWEVTTTMVIQGMPMQPPPTTRTHCITKKDIVPKPDKDK